MGKIKYFKAFFGGYCKIKGGFFNMINKARYWSGVLYPENMIDDWEKEIGDIVQVPYAYCIHDADLTGKEEDRKVHVHLILVFPNTTTYNHALNVFKLLSKPGFIAINTCQAVVSIRGSYDYLIHDTDTARKQNKKQYDSALRITGNNFDIGSYEQLGIAERNDLCNQLCDIIISEKFTNFTDFYEFCMLNLFEENSNYFEIIKSYSGLFERLTKGNFQKYGNYCGEQTHETHIINKNICPNCGSDDIKKKGLTVGNKQRWFCKDCGKSWSD